MNHHWKPFQHKSKRRSWKMCASPHPWCICHPPLQSGSAISRSSRSVRILQPLRLFVDVVMSLTLRLEALIEGLVLNGCSTLPQPNPLLPSFLLRWTSRHLGSENTVDGTVPLDAQQVSRHRSPIQSVLVAGNERSLFVAESLRALGFDVRAIRKPTVAEGTERLRITLHAYNTDVEVSGCERARGISYALLK